MNYCYLLCFSILLGSCNLAVTKYPLPLIGEELSSIPIDLHGVWESECEVGCFQNNKYIVSDHVVEVEQYQLEGDELIVLGSIQYEIGKDVILKQYQNYLIANLVGEYEGEVFYTPILLTNNNHLIELSIIAYPENKEQKEFVNALDLKYQLLFSLEDVKDGRYYLYEPDNEDLNNLLSSGKFLSTYRTLKKIQ